MNETLGGTLEGDDYPWRLIAHTGPPWDDALESNNKSKEGPTTNGDPSLFDFEVTDDMVYLFDSPNVRITFIVLYSIVFCSCFIGNLMVILVVTLHWRMRSITNFFLANLAIADFCVGIFCIYQNLSIYLIQSWILGGFLCKMYHFIDRLSHTASILILCIIAIERYLAILHPMHCKRILTLNRLRLAIVAVWLVSALINSPRLYYFHTMTHYYGSHEMEIICGPDRTLFNTKTSDIFNLVFLYLAPLLLISILYTRIALVLWRTSRKSHLQESSYSPTHSICSNNSSICGVRRGSHTNFNTTSFLNESRGILPSPVPSTSSPEVKNSKCSGKRPKKLRSVPQGPPEDHEELNQGHSRSKSVQRTHLERSRRHLQSSALASRLGVIKMLIAIVSAFAICNLPFHMRKMWQYYAKDYGAGSNFSTFLTVFSTLVMYGASSINPILYGFLSAKFRASFADFCCCRMRRALRERNAYKFKDAPMVSVFKGPIV